MKTSGRNGPLLSLQRDPSWPVLGQFGQLFGPIFIGMFGQLNNNDTIRIIALGLLALSPILNRRLRRIASANKGEMLLELGPLLGRARLLLVSAVLIAPLVFFFNVVPRRLGILHTLEFVLPVVVALEEFVSIGRKPLTFYEGGIQTWYYVSWRSIMFTKWLPTRTPVLRIDFIGPLGGAASFDLHVPLEDLATVDVIFANMVSRHNPLPGLEEHLLRLALQAAADVATAIDEDRK